MARVRSNPTLLPGEFAALGVTLRDWTLRDSARVGVYLARTVPSGDGVELENARALQTIGSRAFVKLLPLRNKGRITTVPAREGSFPSQPRRTRRQEKRAFRRSRRFVRGLRLPSASSSSSRSALGGSYMWAIRAPGHHAYLFNGPQLGYSIPELFVEFELHSPVQNVRGVSAAGVPLVGIGHNDHLAWGFTSGLSDEDDLYAERLAGPEGYVYKGRTLRMDCRDERFDWRASPPDLPDVILGGKPVSGSRTERICRTRHGPVQARASGVAYARRYAIWGRELETIVGLTALNDARTVRDVDRALRQVTWNENVIAADDGGNIGYWHPGLHPLRPRGYDERLPYPGTGKAEWRGLLNRRRTPHVINPRQGYLFNWNNMPSAGWTNGDTEARERATGPFHRSRWLRLLVRRVKRRPAYEASRAIDGSSGTTAQQRAFATRRLRRALRRARGRSAAVLRALLSWDGSYVRTAADGTVDPGVAIWEEFKSQVREIALRRLLPRRVPVSAAAHLAGQTGSSHQFDITLGESYGLRTLSARGLATAALSTDRVLTGRFHTSDISRWREPRRMYEVSAQGAAATPDLPFFDRGTWEQSVALGP
jgi:penicillin amidase